MNRQAVENDVPYTMKLPDGRIVFVEVPAQYCVRDRSGEIGFTPDGVKLLDHVRVMAMKTPPTPTPGYIRTLREALGLTQEQFGQRAGVDKMTVWRWERGQIKPRDESVKGIETMRREAVRKGVMLAG